MSTTAALLQAAIAHHQAGRLAEAELGYVELLQRDADHVDALYLLGFLAHQARRHDDAVALVQRAIQLRPAAANFHVTLGDAYRLLSRYSEAESALLRALELQPESRDARTNLALVLKAQGRMTEALPLLLETLAEYGEDEPWPPLLRTLAIDAIRTSDPVPPTPSLRSVLLRMCADPQVAASSIAHALLSSVRDTAAFRALDAESPSCTGALAETDEQTWEAIIADPLLVAMLPRLTIADEAFERVLTQLRSWLLRRTVADGAPAIVASERAVRFAAALAQQSFNVEYAWPVSERERALLSEAPFAFDILDEAANAGTSEAGNELQIELLLSVAAAYAPLSARADARHILAAPVERWSDMLGAVVRQQLVEPQQERDLAAALPTLTPIADGVSQSVRAMYEDNPYPRWVDLERPGTIDTIGFIAALRGRDVKRPVGKPPILVAGCGTGRQPIQVALQFADSHVLAIDLSRTSLSYAAREALEHRVLNLTFAQADILELDLKGRVFTMISCSGVLHHLSDPLSGWRRLVQHLAPDGVMKIGLYSTRARRSVEAARAFVAAAGYGSSADEIRRCRQAILALPHDHPARGVARFPDFFSVSGCRDLIMHVQERSYTISQLAESLASLGLRFLGFQTDALTQRRFRDMFSATEAMRDLSCWGAFEEAYPDSFAGMYQLWCDRD